VRNRSSNAAARSLSGREYALGIEALDRFICKERLRFIRDHAYGVPADEAELVDPRALKSGLFMPFSHSNPGGQSVAQL
jgi:hypothetical protein